MSETELETPQTESQEELSDQEAILKIAQAMKDNTPTPDEKQNIHTFLFNVVTAKDSTKVGNLRDDKELNELGVPESTVRGAKDMALISKHIMNNKFFEQYFLEDSENTLATSLSRNGFLLKIANTTTKQISDSTKRRKINKGWFGKSHEESSGGDLNSPNI